MIQSLVECNLGCLLLTDVMELLPGLLLGPSCISILDLSHNLIGDAGIRELSLCLTKSSTLEMLQLSHNRIGENGCLTLLVCVLTVEAAVCNVMRIPEGP